MHNDSVIVIEGPDGTGKTTLAKRLETHGYRYVHCGPPERDALKFYINRVRAEPGKVVTDRLHVGSWVYGTAFRNGPDMTDHEEWLMQGWLRARGGLLVYSTVPEEKVDENLSRGPDSADAEIYEVKEKRAQVRGLYESYLRSMNLLPVVEYDFTKSDSIVSLLAEADELTKGVPAFTASMIGNPRAKTVFVGEGPFGPDRIRKRYEDEPELAEEIVERAGRVYEVGTVFNSQSGRYLFQCLRASGLTLNDYCIINAKQWDGRTLSHLAREDPDWFKGPREFVALGRVAEYELNELRLRGFRFDFRVLPHPQWVKRFHYRDVLKYAKLLSGEEHTVDWWSSRS